MRRLGKILLWFVVIGISLVVILSALALIYQEKVTDYALTKLNEEFDTRIEVESATFSLLRRFPRASVELKDLTIWSPEGVDYAAFGEYQSDTLLYASSFFLEIPVVEFFRGNYSISSLTIDRGFVNALTDGKRRSSYNLARNGTREGAGLDLNIDNIRVNSLYITYISIVDSLHFEGEVVSSRVKGMIAGSNIDLKSEAELKIVRVKYPGREINRQMASSFSVDLFKTVDELQITKGIFNIAGLDFDITGNYYIPFRKVNFHIVSERVEIGELMALLPEKIVGRFENFAPQGRLNVDGVVEGMISGVTPPFFDFAFSLENGSILSAGSPVTVHNVMLKGDISNGANGIRSVERVNLENFSAIVGNGDISGQGTLTNFSNPDVDFTLSATIVGTEWYSFLNPKGISYISGVARLNSRIRGKMPVNEKDILKTIASLDPIANVTFSNFSVGITKGDYSMDDITGNMMLAGGLWTDDLSLTFRDHSFRLAGEIVNMPSFLAGNDKVVRGTMTVWSDLIDIRRLLLTDSPSDTTNLYNPFELFSLDGEIIADSLVYSNFRTSRVSSMVKVRPDGIIFTGIVAETLGGRVSGNYNLWRRQNGRYLSKGDLKIFGCDIREGFGQFNNFGQTFIVQENIGGKLSGNISFLFDHLPTFYPDMPTLVADGRYTIINGELVNFEPIKQLSRFIDIKELENIKFSKLENELLIKYSTVTVPRMEIGSTAADIVISGTHYFSNDYEYHLKVKLSDILNKNRREKLGPNKEFGPVEDDGLGRPSILIKITSVGDDFKVAYDVAAAKGEIKQDIQKEKSTLKSILNEEYGWYKSDTTIKKTEQEKPRFRVRWEENNPTPAETIPAPKEGLLKKIIKK